jgi:excinuclease UvrABC helicase subunit UvrB
MPIRKVSYAARRSLIQVSGRAARNVHGKVIMYADDP